MLFAESSTVVQIFNGLVTLVGALAAGYVLVLQQRQKGDLKLQKQILEHQNVVMETQHEEAKKSRKEVKELISNIEQKVESISAEKSSTTKLGV